MADLLHAQSLLIIGKAKLSCVVSESQGGDSLFVSLCTWFVKVYSPFLCSFGLYVNFHIFSLNLSTLGASLDFGILVVLAGTRDCVIHLKFLPLLRWAVADVDSAVVAIVAVVE